MEIDGGLITGIIVALIAAASAFASQRAAARASVYNADINARVLMEKDAYERARKFDTETILRQTNEITALRAEVANLESKVSALIMHIVKLEQGHMLPRYSIEGEKPNE